jgi:hypothetical protein
VIGEETAKQVRKDYPLAKLDCIAVKGKTKGVDIYTVLTKKPDGPDNAYHNLFLSHYKNQEWKAAKQQAKILKATAFGGELNDYYDMMCERIDELAKMDLPKDWDGVYRATSK